MMLSTNVGEQTTRDDNHSNRSIKTLQSNLDKTEVNEGCHESEYLDRNRFSTDDPSSKLYESNNFIDRQRNPTFDAQACNTIPELHSEYPSEGTLTTDCAQFKMIPNVVNMLSSCSHPSAWRTYDGGVAVVLDSNLVFEVKCPLSDMSCARLSSLTAAYAVALSPDSLAITNPVCRIMYTDRTMMVRSKTGLYLDWRPNNSFAVADISDLSVEFDPARKQIVPARYCLENIVDDKTIAVLNERSLSCPLATPEDSSSPPVVIAHRRNAENTETAYLTVGQWRVQLSEERDGSVCAVHPTLGLMRLDANNGLICVWNDHAMVLQRRAIQQEEVSAKMMQNPPIFAEVQLSTENCQAQIDLNPNDRSEKLIIQNPLCKLVYSRQKGIEQVLV